MTLLEHLTQLYPTAKRTTLRRMLDAGRIEINGKRAHSMKQIVMEEDRVRVQDRTEQLISVMLPFPIVFEDRDLLVIDKPAGLLTSTVPREKRPTALAMVRQYVAAREPNSQIGLIHRLDRDASGLLVFSKNHDTYLSLKRQFFEHTVERIYQALVHGVPNPRSGMIDSRLVERADGSVHSAGNDKRGERAVTYYETISQPKKGLSVLRVRLQTGKKHQIRAHLAERATPIVNDPVYSKGKKPTGRLMLAAVELRLVHPRTQKAMNFKVEPKLLEQLNSPGR